ncbi:MAG TPA: hypothetical protein VF138_12845 [Caulobacteraceae bacterium]
MTRLSDVETEQLRDIRSRLNRVPKGQLGDKSVGPLSKGFFDVCERTFGGAPAELRREVAELAALKAADPAAFRKAFDAGALQAIVTRRLVIGGRERSSEELT